MLRGEVPFPINNQPAKFIVFLLGEGFLGFLAIIAVALALFQMWFSLAPAGNALVNLMQWGIIGWFGMNLIDNPWPFTLKQVSFCVVFAMVLCLYFFFVKGWLR